MLNLCDIIAELRSKKGTNAKKAYLKEHGNNVDLKALLKFTYDPRLKYYIKNTQIKPTTTGDVILTRELLIEILQPLVSRTKTGNAAKEWVHEYVNKMTKECQDLFLLLLKRDLRISLNVKSINEVLGHQFIYDLPYMRCKVLDETTSKKIKFPAYVQLKADGMFVNIIHTYDKETDTEKIELRSRQGELLPVIQKILESDLLIGLSKQREHNYVIHGEILINGILDRKKANGILNRDVIPEEYHDLIYISTWDELNYDDWIKGEHLVPYHKRLSILQMAVDQQHILLEEGVKYIPRLQIIDTHEVNSIEEVFKYYNEYVGQGLEGAVLKNKDGIWKYYDSPDQLKVKIIFEVDLRLIGFNPGTGRFEETFGSLELKSDDNLVTSNVSGLKDKDRNYLWENKDKVLGKVITIKGNDLFEPNESSDVYKISHPRFVEVRYDKNETNTLQEIIDIVNSKKFIESKAN